MGNPMNVNAKNWMVQCLHQLASTEFQERVWVRGEGPEAFVISFGPLGNLDVNFDGLRML